MKPYYSDDLVTLYHADCLEVLPTLPDASVDAIITDPPYEIGFMGKQWDRSGIAFNPAVWAECLRVAKPGAHLLAFGGARTWHRLAVAIEDAGWQIKDNIAWLYAEGKPSHRDSLKPAFEPIVFARNGVGPLNINDCRDGLDGRWPPNVLLEDDAAPVLDAQAGERPSGGKKPYIMAEHAANTVSSLASGMGGKLRDYTSEASSGPASRFFPVFRYESKAPQSERPSVAGVQHTTVKPLALMQWLARLVTPNGGIILDPFAGSGTTGEAAILEGYKTTLIEQEADYLPLIEHRLRRANQPLFSMGVSA